MEKDKISTEKIKAVLSMASLALLAIQHFIGVFTNDVQVSYIPLAITFFTIFINTLGENEMKTLNIFSLIGVVCILLPGAVIYTINGYGLKTDAAIEQMYGKILFFVIAIISLILCILYIKRICEIE